jgi:hypothetical protein
LEFKQGGRRGREAFHLTSRRRFEEETRGNWQIVGVKKVSFLVASLAQGAEETRLQGSRQDESLDAVEI